MNKAELIEKIAVKTQCSKKDTTEIVNLVFEEIGNSLKNCEDVRLSGFGNFFAKEKESHKGVNPKTKKEVVVEKGKKIIFHPSETFKENIK